MITHHSHSPPPEASFPKQCIILRLWIPPTHSCAQMWLQIIQLLLVAKRMSHQPEFPDECQPKVIPHVRIERLHLSSGIDIWADCVAKKPERPL